MKLILTLSLLYSFSTFAATKVPSFDVEINNLTSKSNENFELVLAAWNTGSGMGDNKGGRSFCVGKNKKQIQDLKDKMTYESFKIFGCFLPKQNAEFLLSVKVKGSDDYKFDTTLVVVDNVKKAKNYRFSFFELTHENKINAKTDSGIDLKSWITKNNWHYTRVSYQFKNLDTNKIIKENRDFPSDLVSDSRLLSIPTIGSRFEVTMEVRVEGNKTILKSSKIFLDSELNDFIEKFDITFPEHI